MKTKWCLLILCLAAAIARAQTNLSALLQQGMFEEEANHNLTAAMANYRTLADQFDKDRQVAATAIFRLGECYREQGDTNNAAIEYRRILHDFSDQQSLVTLSRQDLAGMGLSQSIAGQTADDSKAGVWNKVKDLPESELEKVLLVLAPDPVLTSLLQQRNDAETKLANIKTDQGPSSSEIQAQTAALSEINQQISDKIGGIMEALKIQYAESAPPEATVATSDEDREIQRIQAMIQNSPDLINAPDDQGHTPLENAAIKGQLKVAAFLLDHGADVNLAGSTGDSPLVAAARSAQRGMATFLLDHGADINARGNAGHTALHAAAFNGFEAVAQTLLAGHPNINATDIGGETPLVLAAQNGHAKIVQMLLAARADPNVPTSNGETAVSRAASVSPEIVNMLLAAGANPNTVNRQGRTILSFAIQLGSLDTVKLLLAAKADPNDATNDAPLLCAVDKGDLASAELLLQAGANPNVDGLMHSEQGSYGSRWDGHFGAIMRSATPLWLAIQKHQLPMVQLLLKYKANPDAQTSEPPPVIFWALSDTNILEALLDAGANPNIMDGAGRTPLSHAAENGSLEVVKLLLAAKADPNANTFDPLLGYAIRKDNPEIVKALLQAGANPNQADAKGNFPLHDAVYRLDQKIFQLLLDDGADPNRKNPDGYTPLKHLEEVASGNLTLGNGTPTDQQKTLAAALADYLRHRGALEVLPDWGSITVSSRSGSDSVVPFSKGTNDWNQFTLLETVFGYFQTPAESGIFHFRSYDNSVMSFPDLSRVRIVRPRAGTTNVTVIKISLLDHDGEIDCSKDAPLQFGDTVQISQREHTLSESDTNLPAWLKQISTCLQNRAGAVKLIVDGSQTIQIDLGQYGPVDPTIGRILAGPQAQNVLTSDSDLSRVKVISKMKGAKTAEWTLDCSDLNYQMEKNRSPVLFMTGSDTDNGCPDLWLRDGDVIEVPERQ